MVLLALLEYQTYKAFVFSFEKVVSQYSLHIRCLVFPSINRPSAFCIWVIVASFSSCCYCSQSITRLKKTHLFQPYLKLHLLLTGHYIWTCTCPHQSTDKLQEFFSNSDHSFVVPLNQRSLLDFSSTMCFSSSNTLLPAPIPLALNTDH